MIWYRAGSYADLIWICLDAIRRCAHRDWLVTQMLNQLRDAAMHFCMSLHLLIILAIFRISTNGVIDFQFHLFDVEKGAFGVYHSRRKQYKENGRYKMVSLPKKKMKLKSKATCYHRGFYTHAHCCQYESPPKRQHKHNKTFDFFQQHLLCFVNYI